MKTLLVLMILTMNAAAITADYYTQDSQDEIVTISI
jgi:hypothetical protein